MWKKEKMYTEDHRNSKSNAHDEALPKIDIDMILATRILQDELRKGNSRKNVVCSPLSLEFALHMLAAGSKGNTLSQILHFIGLKLDGTLNSMDALNFKSRGIMSIASSQVADKELELSFANGVWLDHKYKLKPSFKVLMNSIYKAKAETVDFVNEADQIIDDVNSWVAENTNGLINEILTRGSLGPRVMLILVNALYFKGLWDCNSKLDPEMSKDRDFHLLDGSKVSAPFMTRFSPHYLFRAFNDFKVLQLNYRKEKHDPRELCMLVLLPNKRDGLQKLLKKCISDPDFLHQDFGLSYEEFSLLWIPKFEFTYKLEDVSGIMKDLGLTLPFDPECQDLTEMVEMNPETRLRITRILHKATIVVDEGGTKAAAVTEESEEDMGFSLYEPPKMTFVADHPFVFMIKEVNTGAIFFVGAVFNPQQDERINSPAAMAPKKHHFCNYL